MKNLTWPEYVETLVAKPEAASVFDIARMAAEWMNYRQELERLREIAGEIDAEITNKLLEDER